VIDGADAAKRRQLPAWIREGLEKMEREKQRQLEKEKQIQDAVHAKKLEEQEDSEAVNDNSSEKGLTKSRFVCCCFVQLHCSAAGSM